MRRWASSPPGRPSLAKIAVTCFCTARSLITARSAIARFDSPSATRPSTSRSRGRQDGERIVLAAARQQVADHLRVERRPAGRDAAQRAGEVLDVGHAVLEQVAEPGRRLGQQAHRDAGLDVVREDHDADARMAVAHRAGRDEPLLGVRRRHPDVDDRDVRRVRVDGRDELVGVRRLGDDVEARAAQQRGDPLADQQAVVGDDDAHAPRPTPA